MRHRALCSGDPATMSWRVYVGTLANCPTDAVIANLGIQTGPRGGNHPHLYFTPPTEADARAFVHGHAPARPHDNDWAQWTDPNPDTSITWTVIPGYNLAAPGLPVPPAASKDGRYWWNVIEGKLKPILVFDHEKDALAFIAGRPQAIQGWPFAQNPHQHRVEGCRDGFEMLKARVTEGGAGAEAIQRFIDTHRASFARLRLHRPKVWQNVSTTPLFRFLSGVASSAGRHRQLLVSVTPGRDIIVLA